MNCPRCGKDMEQDGGWPIKIDGEWASCCLTCWESYCAAFEWPREQLERKDGGS